MSLSREKEKIENIIEFIDRQLSKEVKNSDPYSFFKDKKNKKIKEYISARGLNDKEVIILRECLKPEKQNYEEISKKIYLQEQRTREIASDLWQRIRWSFQTEEQISKSNLKNQIGKVIKKSVKLSYPQVNKFVYNTRDENPNGLVPLNSPYYVDRFDRLRRNITIETRCFQEILKPYALVKIQSPRFMGKTSLVKRVVAKVKTQETEYLTVHIDLADLDIETLKDTKNFLQLFCYEISEAIKVQPKVEELWKSILGSNKNCHNYLERYLLPEIDCPLVLVLDNLDRLFPYEETAINFCSLLRSWHEKGKEDPLWGNLRLLLAYSTQPSIKLPANDSPFANVGTYIKLPEFNLEQVTDLANNRYSLNLNSKEINYLMAMVGGHPYLIRLSLYHLQQQNITLKEVLEDSILNNSIYKQHLLALFKELTEIPDLKNLYSKIVNSEDWFEVNEIEACDLERLGLIEKNNGKVRSSLNLYRSYFQRVLS